MKHAKLLACLKTNSLALGTKYHNTLSCCRLKNIWNYIFICFSFLCIVFLSVQYLNYISVFQLIALN